MKKSLIRIIKVLGIVFTILYPFVVFFALRAHIALRAMGLFLLAMAGISFIRNKNVWIFICVLMLCLGLVICDQDIFLKLYPVIMNISISLMFALSLYKTPLVEKFAKKMGYALDESQKTYTKKATIAWAIFMGILAILSVITVFLSNEIWVIFNGLISYILIAIMMCVEFLVRKKAQECSQK